MTILLLYPSKEELKKIKHRLYSKMWRINNPDGHNKTQQKWRKNNPIKYKEIQKRWITNNADKAKLNHANWQKEHSDKHNQDVLQWLKTPLGKICAAKHSSKRNRELGHDLLNDYFDGCEQHHINDKQVVCIPREIHRLHPHNHNKPDTMIEINRIALQYVFNYKI